MRYALAMLSALILSGCGISTRNTAVTAEAACSVWPVTPYSKADTPQTIEGNRLNNSRREGWCGKD